MMNAIYLKRAITVIALISLGVLANAQDDEFEPVDLPENIAAKVRGLPEEKVDFLRGDGVFGFAERHDILFDRLASKSSAQIEAYIDAMIRGRENKNKVILRSA